MRINVTESMFIQAFKDYGREDNFSEAGLSAMYEYFTELEQGIGEEIELDVIGLCCAFSEYTSLGEFQAVYSDDYDSLDLIRDYTTVIEIDEDAFIIEDF